MKDTSRSCSTVGILVGVFHDIFLLELPCSLAPGCSVTIEPIAWEISYGTDWSIASYNHPIPQGFSIIILKPYVKSVTHSEKLEWWNILMVECVTILLYTSVKWSNIPPLK